MVAMEKPEIKINLVDEVDIDDKNETNEQTTK